MHGVGIDVQQLRVGYDGVVVLHDIDLKIEAAEFVALLGASGCGKTTLLRSLAGFVKPLSGRVLVEGNDILALPPDRRNMAMVFQSYALWPHMTVRQNIGYGLRLRRVAKQSITEKVDALLEMLGLQAFAERKVPQLSGGQRQRVALGRALAVDSPILLLDEPLSNLDARIRLSMRHEIRALQQRLGLTCVHVTHDREEAMVMADRIVILDQGRIAQVGTPLEVYERPQSSFVARFMGAENAIDLQVARTDNRLLLDETELHKKAELPISQTLEDGGVNWQAKETGPVTVRFRSDAAHLRTAVPVPDGHLGIQGTIKQTSYPGGIHRYEVLSQGRSFMIDDPARYSTGEAVTICLPAEGLHIYTPDRAAKS